MCKYGFYMLFTIMFLFLFFCWLIITFFPHRYNRAETTRNLLWKIGPVLPKEIEEKLNHWEEDYFKKHSAWLKSYKSKVLVDLTVVTSPSFISFPFLSHVYQFMSWWSFICNQTLFSRLRFGCSLFLKVDICINQFKHRYWYKLYHRSFTERCTYHPYHHFILPMFLDPLDHLY